ncbi:hypothetical protein HO133_009688 [Letharia lupina]|uniref:NAD-dependent 15-hydroxyprostaglandin dehydrogenase n=1 Tax=Letharia lupina TaxID=560253 RepID=A0A8H6CLE9_9LECA|nr:uncharacterized protein HO133_009688 [Letharia lupina]KAF6225688.1 hypothetical protein HO133_009688 [Letharia lupina]
MALPLAGLAGKTAIITGAGSGINLSFARALLTKRCNVVFADLALRPEAQELVSNHANRSQSPAKAVFQKTDVRDWQQLERMFHVASKEFGGADIVCPGAGVYEPPFSNFWHPPGKPPSEDDPTSNRYAILDINLTHPIRTTQLAISHFLSSSSSSSSSNKEKSSPKSIVHISSIAGQVTPLPGPIYNATKHGINGFVRSLAPLDSRLGIRVTGVAPGVIKTPLWTEAPEKLKLIADDDAWVTPEFVADVMVSLVENQTVRVSAGLGATGSRLSSGDAREGTKEVAVEGGMILEVAKGRVRVVEQFNDVGPSGEGNTVGNMRVAEEEILERLAGGGWGVD